MTSEQRDILKTNVEGDGSGYTIVTIEYPADEHGALKIVTRQNNSNQADVDIYGPDGRTVESRSFAWRDYAAREMAR